MAMSDMAMSETSQKAGQSETSQKAGQSKTSQKAGQPEAISGVNEQGNRWITPGGTNTKRGSSYHYSNQDGSYYYRNDDGSSYYCSPSGVGFYKPPPRKGESSKWKVVNVATNDDAGHACG